MHRRNEALMTTDRSRCGRRIRPCSRFQPTLAARGNSHQRSRGTTYMKNCGKKLRQLFRSYLLSASHRSNSDPRFYTYFDQHSNYWKVKSCRVFLHLSWRHIPHDDFGECRGRPSIIENQDALKLGEVKQKKTYRRLYCFCTVGHVYRMVPARGMRTRRRNFFATLIAMI